MLLTPGKTPGLLAHLVISYLGYRASFMGVWLPWVVVQPGVLVNDMPTVTYNDVEFWKVHRQDLEVADKLPVPERDDISPISRGIQHVI